MPPKGETKYRPSLPASSVYKILELAKCESPISDESLELIATFSVLKTKIENNGITAAYVTKPKESLASSLGAPDTATDIIDARGKEAIWRDSYHKYKEAPKSCSTKEIQEAHEHMYLNELMTPEELGTYEVREGIRL